METQQDEKVHKNYELAYLLVPHASEEEVSAWLGKTTNIIQEGGGMIRETPEPKRQILSYPIKKQKTALFGWMLFTAPNDMPEKIRTALRHDTQLLRMLVIQEQRDTKPRIPLKPQPKETPQDVVETPQDAVAIPTAETTNV